MIPNILINYWYVTYLLIPHALFIVMQFTRHKDQYIQTITLKNLYFFLFVIFLLLLQIAFYSASIIPSNTRYDFPITVFFIIYLTSLIQYYKDFLKYYDLWRIQSKVIIAIILSFFIYQKNPITTLSQIRIDGATHRENTVNFNNFLKELKNVSYKNLEFPIIVKSFNVWDYELISSIYKYSQYYAIPNTISLKLHYTVSDYNTEVEKLFVRRLESVSNNDGEWKPENYEVEWGYEIYNLEETEKSCISVNIRHDASNSNCSEKLELTYNGR